MKYMCNYNSAIGNLILASNGEAITGIWFEDQKNFINTFKEINENLPIFKRTKNWLDIYFSGKEPDFMPKVFLEGSDFRIRVWEYLKKIPYGKVITYGDIAKDIAKEKGIRKMSAQAVGSAIGHNPVGIIIPCHRVIGNKNNLTGYAGGIERKRELLRLEGIDVSKMSI